MYKVIPFESMRYRDVGDWHDNGEIIVADTGNEDYNFLIALHELVEWYFCRKAGITDEVVTAFDNSFGDGEAGMSKDAPYHKQHKFATQIEKLVSKRLGVDWKKYGKAVDALYEPTNTVSDLLN